MRRLIRSVVDFAALIAACWVTHLAFGYPWGLAGIVAMGVYGCWCFFDGAAGK